ncbi:probable disease resistance protein At5g63020 isoform X1 [Mangifera indica]|uniref:probable disease resistance protein At5g63020 isoform X1 n=1 Tax=Mangifera indica TaxID=29780 RepID=UPI001CFA3B54|nr:probable disease resistance protein At5g63020 isoform X1 [Mangifera indica]XP_044485506.1 probable disease resistance protein At5g63020 isoform X1 [Mangifera indica]XP_044485507.1 probable disease resistance protein At5g63020 isoform X1 [Mangifera indica]XP_044485508.1 probable disease resistance protein At5g63020 isoform X1 [Mangifera indica]XP_044485509.1 probable disease resistance protein At5g63020 isoform X1 [Mangifera indica]XP_044485510.1 probable disease resistance protein At5g63020
MGNIFSVSISGDAIFFRCLNCTSRKVAYISELEDNLDALQTELQKLQEARNDLLRKIELVEKNGKKRTDQVQGWLSRVRDVEAEAGGLLEIRSQEIEKLCFGGYCSKNCKSSFKFGKLVANKLKLVATLKDEGVFEVVAENIPETVAVERPSEPTVVGMQLIVDTVWRCIEVEEEQVGIIGLYGMGGVGKTTLLTKINNKFLEISNNFDIVIWVLVSRDLQVEKIQERIGQKIGLDGESWKNKSVDEKASDIFKILRKKKFVVLLDDLWDRVDLIKVGIPLPSVEVGCKIVFTTRFLDVCGLMEANRKFKVECLREAEAWELFEGKVGRETLDSHPGILELAKVVAKECGGLPLALITIGRAMSYKKTPEEWKYAIQVLRRASSKFPGMEKEVYPLLKFSYDCLPNDKIRSCLLYCSLFPEDFSIIKTKLIDYWFCENFLDVYDPSEVYSHGYYIIGVLVHAGLLEEVEERGDYFVKMHDVIRNMTLWIACEMKEEQQKFLVQVRVGLTKAPTVNEWEELKRISLMENKIEDLSVTPTCPDLLTLFLNSNNIQMISSSFFQFMPSLKVLNLSYNKFLIQLPSGISNLVSLQHLDLSWSSIIELPVELKALVKLKCLSLEYTYMLCKIPSRLISHFSELHILRMIGCGYNQKVGEDSVLFGGGEKLVEELLGLESLNVLSITLKSGHALQTFLSSNKFRNSTYALTLRHLDGSKMLNVLSLADLKHLRRLEIEDCEDLEELKMEHLKVLQKTREPYNFCSLNRVQIVWCSRIRDLTWLVLVPNLKYLFVSHCYELEEIISNRNFGEEFLEMIDLFAKLHFINIRHLPNLKSIYWKALPFPHLNLFYVIECPKLKKIPLDSDSAKGQKIVISGNENWWKGLEWESEAAQNAFLPCFQSR